MDDTDRKLMLQIYEDPRISTRDLAKKLGISRQAVHRRMQFLTRIGLFRNMPASLSIHYLKGFNVMIFGRSETTSIEKTLAKLGESEFTFHVVVAGGNYVYVIGFLRNVSELDDYYEFVKKEADMPGAIMGIVRYGDGINPDWADGRPRQSYREPSPLDLRIVASLRDDARKPITRIADIVGVSAKTVRRHLEDMKSDALLDFDEPWDMPPGEDMFTLIHLNLKDGADKVKVAKRLHSKDPLHALYFRSYANLPNFLFGFICSDRMTVIRRILREIGEDDDVLEVTPNLLYFERMYWTTWDTKLYPTDLKHPVEKAGRHKLQSGRKARR